MRPQSQWDDWWWLTSSNSTCHDRCESATMHLFKEGLMTIGEYTSQVAANPHFGKCNPGKIWKLRAPCTAFEVSLFRDRWARWDRNSGQDHWWMIVGFAMRKQTTDHKRQQPMGPFYNICTCVMNIEYPMLEENSYSVIRSYKINAYQHISKLGASCGFFTSGQVQLRFFSILGACSRKITVRNNMQQRWGKSGQTRKD